jgi:hypothetical protein
MTKIKFAISLVFFFCCIASSAQKEKLKCFCYISTFPILGIDGTVQNEVRDTINFYSYKGMLMFKLPYHFTFVDNSDSNNNTQSIQYDYFIYNNNEENGYLFRPNPMFNDGWFSLDSILRVRDFYENSDSFYYGIMHFQPILISSSGKPGKGQITQKYSLAWKQDTTVTGSAVFDFDNKKNDIPFSLSPELDSITKSKLVNLTVRYNSRLIKESNIRLSEFSYTRKLYEQKCSNSNMVLLYFDRFKKLRAERRNSSKNKP